MLPAFVHYFCCMASRDRVACYDVSSRYDPSVSAKQNDTHWPAHSFCDHVLGLVIAMHSVLPYNQYADGMVRLLWNMRRHHNLFFQHCCRSYSGLQTADLAYGCLANKLELLMRPSTRQHFLQLGWSEEELKVDLCVSMVLLVLLYTNRVHMSQKMRILMRLTTWRLWCRWFGTAYSIFHYIHDIQGTKLVPAI